MSLVKKPVTGMKDILPAEMQLRDYAIGIIKKTYGEFGFTSIETPAVESLANLNSKQGGENEKLIFKVMKRGEKLNLETAQSENDLTDSGLRYDLTVPLVRFYAAHQGELPSPFKALQMGNVWRADRPQKGRYRQFMQCDIDILGEASNLAEIELILATTTTLGRLGFEDFKIRINDRQILKAMAAYSSFPKERYDEVFITLDKMDKIGIDGVSEELLKEGFDKASIDKYLDLFRAAEGKEGLDGLKVIADMLGDFLSDEVREGLSEIIASVDATKTSKFEMVFDPTLVRGMSYYTGTIFEVSMPQYGGSCGGGGRYDKMVGKFLGQDTPACGFSIGFERIIMIMMDEGFKIPGESEKTAFLIEKGIGGERLSEIIKEAQEERASGKQVLVVRMNKNKKFQKQQLTDQGYTDFKEFYLNPLN
ncbi:MAG: histidine--tRNA ligase [Butyrivibrio sp.]|uniref:histidine--tRNA ligase n=1 Tax=Butyrivibrio sp. TaxID=28121 RepID=UPI001B5FD7FC|nr:histidine--tRNA ligase [Butyrivibrio sp.]MBP3782924.1 histidine--tRNA ligase [Butyrivibrio sp.]